MYIQLMEREINRVDELHRRRAIFWHGRWTETEANNGLKQVDGELLGEVQREPFTLIFLLMKLPAVDLSLRHLLLHSSLQLWAVSRSTKQGGLGASDESRT